MFALKITMIMDNESLKLRGILATLLAQKEDTSILTAAEIFQVNDLERLHSLLGNVIAKHRDKLKTVVIAVRPKNQIGCIKLISASYGTELQGLKWAKDAYEAGSVTGLTLMAARALVNWIVADDGSAYISEK